MIKYHCNTSSGKKFEKDLQLIKASHTPDQYRERICCLCRATVASTSKKISSVFFSSLPKRKRDAVYDFCYPCTRIISTDGKLNYDIFIEGYAEQSYADDSYRPYGCEIVNLPEDYVCIGCNTPIKNCNQEGYTLRCIKIDDEMILVHSSFYSYYSKTKVKCSFLGV